MDKEEEQKWYNWGHDRGKFWIHYHMKASKEEVQEMLKQRKAFLLYYDWTPEATELYLEGFNQACFERKGLRNG